MNTTVKNLPVASVTVEAGHNPRLDFDSDELKQLAASVKEHGVLQPILVTKAGQGYKLIAGERRLRAAKLAKLDSIPAVIRADVNGDGAALALIENVVRADLNPVEEAQGYHRLIEGGKTVKQIVKVLSVREERVKARLAILALPESVQAKVADGTLPLTTIDSLAGIAAQAPTVAEAVAAAVPDPIRPSVVAENPGDAVAHVVRARQGDYSTCPACNGAGETEEGDEECPACEGSGDVRVSEEPLLPLAPVGWTRDLSDFAGLLSAEKIAELQAALDEAVPDDGTYDTQNYRSTALSLTGDAADAARAYGCLMEFDRHGRQAWVTDAEWLADRLGQQIATAKTNYGKSTRATAQHAEGYTPGEKADKDARKREREEAKKAQAKARAANEKMGADLIAKRGTIKVTKDVALTLAYLILGGDRYQGINTAQSVAVSGLRYVHPDLARTREVRGKTSHDLATADEATGFLWEWISRAKTADEVIGRTLAAVLAGTYADEDAAPTKKAQTEKGSSYSLPTVTGGWSLTPADEAKLPGAKQLNDQLPALLDKLAGGVIPPALIKKAHKG